MSEPKNVDSRLSTKETTISGVLRSPALSAVYSEGGKGSFKRREFGEPEQRKGGEGRTRRSARRAHCPPPPHYLHFLGRRSCYRVRSAANEEAVVTAASQLPAAAWRSLSMNASLPAGFYPGDRVSAICQSCPCLASRNSKGTELKASSCSDK